MPGCPSADWVLPVSAPPIENGAVAVEDGRIAAVGPAAELGEGRRFTDAALVPGFVHAHPHLECELRVLLVQLTDRDLDRQSGADCPLGIVLVRRRSAEHPDDDQQRAPGVPASS